MTEACPPQTPELTPVLETPPAKPVQKPKITKKTVKKVVKKKAPKPEPVPIPYLFERTEIRKGTFDWPYLYSICKTESSKGRWYTPVTYIMEMDNLFYHVRKDGIMTSNRDNLMMKCNNGVRSCKWVGTLQMLDRQIKSTDVNFFNPER